MELKHIKELMAAMGRTGTTRLVIKKEEFELQLERIGDGTYRFGEPISTAEEQMMREEQILRRADYTFGSATMVPPSAGLQRHPASEPSKEGHQDTKHLMIKSPMVGTFYAAGSPEDTPFVKVGDIVEEDTVVCIIEAMKVMNEIKAGIAGKVAEVLVDNGHPVEFGTPLYRIV